MLDFDLNEINNPHVVCSALKLYFREMVPPLVPFDFYEKIILAYGN